MADYDPDVLQQYADRLYLRAKTVVGGYAFLTGMIGFIATVAYSIHFSPRDSPLIPAVIIGVITAIPGAIYGEFKSFYLRLEAQKTLCQLAIEQNTRITAKNSNPVLREAAHN